jgi:hypothetical protein
MGEAMLDASKFAYERARSPNKVTHAAMVDAWDFVRWHSKYI